MTDLPLFCHHSDGTGRMGGTPKQHGFPLGELLQSSRVHKHPGASLEHVPKPLPISLSCRKLPIDGEFNNSNGDIYIATLKILLNNPLGEL